LQVKTDETGLGFSRRSIFIVVTTKPHNRRLDMKLLVTLAAAVALCVPAAALADTPPPTATDISAQSCTLQLAQLGTAQFKATYGNYGKCRSKAAQAARAILQNAAKSCKAERSDAGFAAAHADKTFDQFYGAGLSKGKSAAANAYGKCVSAKARASLRQEATAIVGAAKQCKADRAADKTAFAATYGSTANAFGVCVSHATKSS
jgi:hypothetical protein